MKREFHHTSILLEESLVYLEPHSGGFYLDGTLGGGGHAEAILKASGPDGRLMGIDRDQEALTAAGYRLSEFGDRFIPVHGNFKDTPAILHERNIEGIDGAILDLGVSSHQLDTAERGFSYNADAPLDMRMDQHSGITAGQIVNEYSAAQLTNIIRTYGEERWASRIAGFIVREREKAAIDTTGQLVDIIMAAVPAGARREGPHPAKRTFQALRIEVNGELEGLQEAIEGIIGVLKPGGRLCVISFHSLEDRAAKGAMRRMENPCTCPRSSPVCVCGKVPLGKAKPRGAVAPREREVAENPRARSAKMRVFERA